MHRDPVLRWAATSRNGDRQSGENSANRPRRGTWEGSPFLLCERVGAREQPPRKVVAPPPVANRVGGRTRQHPLTDLVRPPNDGEKLQRDVEAAPLVVEGCSEGGLHHLLALARAFAR